jgi:hypothetical protein
MSVSLLARAGRIDTEAGRLRKQGASLNSQLSALVNEVNAFAAFMHSDDKEEFSQQDRDKYSEDFALTLAAVQSTLDGLDALSQLENDQITAQQFLDQSASNPVEYSTRFDS